MNNVISNNRLSGSENLGPGHLLRRPAQRAVPDRRPWHWQRRLQVPTEQHGRMRLHVAGRAEGRARPSLGSRVSDTSPLHNPSRGTTPR